MTIPFTLENIALEGKHVRLEPYDEQLKTPLGAALDCDAAAWNLFTMSGQGATVKPGPGIYATV